MSYEAGKTQVLLKETLFVGVACISLPSNTNLHHLVASMVRENYWNVLCSSLVDSPLVFPCGPVLLSETCSADIFPNRRQHELTDDVKSLDQILEHSRNVQARPRDSSRAYWPNYAAAVD